MTPAPSLTPQAPYLIYLQSHKAFSLPSQLTLYIIKLSDTFPNSLPKNNPNYIKQGVYSSVIRQKGESQNGCLKKTKHTKFSENQKFLTPYTHTYLLPYYRRIITQQKYTHCYIVLAALTFQHRFMHYPSVSLQIYIKYDE